MKTVFCFILQHIYTRLQGMCVCGSMWTVSDTRLQKAACIFVLCDSAYNRGFQQYPFWLLPVVLLGARRYIF